MTQASPHRNWLKVGIIGLEIIGFTAATAIAQVPPDVIIDSEPDARETTTDPTPSDNEPRFVCQLDQGQYTVMYAPESQPGTMYPWAVPQSMGGGWTAERRCNEISRRLESYREDGLVALTTNEENNYDIVCVTTEANNSCQIVFTVPPGQNAIATRDAVFENLADADQGMDTQGVNTFTGNNNNNNILGQLGNILGGISNPRPQSQYSRGINLKPFLDPADGGTGQQLNRGRFHSPRNTPSRPLNPDLFR